MFATQRDVPRNTKYPRIPQFEDAKYLELHFDHKLGKTRIVEKHEVKTT